MSSKLKNLIETFLRIKEKTLLKLVLLWVRIEPLIQKTKSNKQVHKLLSHPAIVKATQKLRRIFPFLNTPKLKIYIWQGLAAIAVIYVISGIISISSFYGEKAETAIDDGKRIIIDLPFGEINARKKSLKTKSRKELTQEAQQKDLAGTEEGEAGGTDGGEQATGATPLNYNIKDVRPRIVIIVSGVGLSRVTTENLFSLPAEVALSFSPYAHGVEEWTIKASDLGYELLMDLSFEPSNYPDSDPGPYGILIASEDEHNIAQINTILNMSDEKFIGVVAPVDEKFTAYEEKIIPILQEIKNKKLTLFYTNKPRNYFLPQTAQKLGLPLIAHDILVDGKLSHEGIEQNIRTAEKIAAEKGFAVLQARPYPITVEHLHKWLKSFEEKGLLLIPLSDIL